MVKLVDRKTLGDFNKYLSGSLSTIPACDHLLWVINLMPWLIPPFPEKSTTSPVLRFALTSSYLDMLPSFSL
jgi:hypothetical protein